MAFPYLDDADPGDLLGTILRLEQEINTLRQDFVDLEKLVNASDSADGLVIRLKDSAGLTRLILSADALDILAEFGVLAHYAGIGDDGVTPEFWHDADNGNLSSGGINGSTGYANVLLHQLGLSVQAGIAQQNGVNWFIGAPSDSANLVGKISGYESSIGGESQASIGIETGIMGGKGGLVTILANADSGQWSRATILATDISGNIFGLTVDGLTGTIKIKYPTPGIPEIDLLHLAPRGALVFAELERQIAGTGRGRSFSTAFAYLTTREASTANSTTGDSGVLPLYIAEGAGMTFTVNGKTGTGYGKVDWYLDGVEMTTGQDWYGSAANNVEKTWTFDIPYSGHHIVTWVVNGKNGSSSDYVFAYGFLKVEPTAGY
jgi:hypothetical protein